MTYPESADLRDLLDALKDSDKAGVRLWKETCELCGGKGYRWFPDYTESCPACSGQGYVVRVAVLEEKGALHGTPERGYADCWRARPCKLELEGVPTHTLFIDRPIKEAE